MIFLTWKEDEDNLDPTCCCYPVEPLETKCTHKNGSYLPTIDVDKVVFLSSLAGGAETINCNPSSGGIRSYGDRQYLCHRSNSVGFLLSGGTLSIRKKSLLQNYVKDIEAESFSITVLEISAVSSTAWAFSLSCSFYAWHLKEEVYSQNLFQRMPLSYL